MSFTSGDACHFGSPIFTIHVLPKALLTKVVELKNRVLRRPKLEEKSVEFFMVAELLAARDFETRSGPGCSSGPACAIAFLSKDFRELLRCHRDPAFCLGA